MPLYQPRDGPEARSGGLPDLAANPMHGDRVGLPDLCGDISKSCGAVASPNRIATDGVEADGGLVARPDPRPGRKAERRAARQGPGAPSRAAPGCENDAGVRFTL